MVSGIGPNQALEELGIPIVTALSGVGQNMWVRIRLCQAQTVPVGVLRKERITSHLVQPMR